MFHELTTALAKPPTTSMFWGWSQFRTNCTLQVQEKLSSSDLDLQDETACGCKLSLNNEEFKTTI